jgi:hypothetical protein
VTDAPIKSSADLPPPVGLTPTVIKDMASDTLGEPRSREGTPPPPGTNRPTFWQNPATMNALGTSLAFVLFWMYAGIDWLYAKAIPSADAVKITFGALIVAWAAAFGIHKTDADALRWK